MKLWKNQAKKIDTRRILAGSYLINKHIDNPEGLAKELLDSFLVRDNDRLFGLKPLKKLKNNPLYKKEITLKGKIFWDMTKEKQELFLEKQLKLLLKIFMKKLYLPTAMKKESIICIKMDIKYKSA